MARYGASWVTKMRKLFQLGLVRKASNTSSSQLVTGFNPALLDYEGRIKWILKLSEIKYGVLNCPHSVDGPGITQWVKNSPKIQKTSTIIHTYPHILTLNLWISELDKSLHGVSFSDLQAPAHQRSDSWHHHLQDLPGHWRVDLVRLFSGELGKCALQQDSHAFWPRPTVTCMAVRLQPLI